MRINLKIWRQKDATSKGGLQDYVLEGVNRDMSFLEMLDMLNDQLVKKGENPVEFDHDCREGICGQCGVMINGIAHGPLKHTTTCQLYMRAFKEGDTIYVEPFRAKALKLSVILKLTARHWTTSLLRAVMYPLTQGRLQKPIIYL